MIDRAVWGGRGMSWDRLMGNVGAALDAAMASEATYVAPDGSETAISLLWDPQQAGPRAGEYAVGQVASVQAIVSAAVLSAPADGGVVVYGGESWSIVGRLQIAGGRWRLTLVASDVEQYGRDGRLIRRM